MYQDLALLERLLVDYVLGPDALGQYDQGDIAKRFLEPAATGLVHLSTQFTTQRQEFTKSYWHETERMAYLLYYLPVNFAKAYAVLAELNHRPEVFSPSFLAQNPIRILDIGCGPGTATLATLAFLSHLDLEAPLNIEIGLYDSSVSVLQDAQALIRQLVKQLNQDQEQLQVKVIPQLGKVAELQKLKIKESASLIWINNVLNETASADQSPLTWLQPFLTTHLDAQGTCLIIEPALRETTRHLMQLRDELLADAPELNVFAPCTAEGNCRMLRDGRERDWCHSDVAWKRPQLVRQLDTLTGLWKSALKFAYLALRRDGLRLHQDLMADTVTVGRVVSDLLKEKGKEKILACTAEELVTLVRLKRDRSSKNQVFHRLERGQLVSAQNLHPGKQPHESLVQADSSLKANGPFLKNEE